MEICLQIVKLPENSVTDPQLQLPENLHHWPAPQFPLPNACAETVYVLVWASAPYGLKYTPSLSSAWIDWVRVYRPMSTLAAI